MIEIRLILIGAISAIIASFFTIIIMQLIGKYFQCSKSRRIRKICIYHLEKLNERLKPTKEEEGKVFFSETKLNEIKTAWYVYEMLLNNIDILNPEKFENTMKFFDNYSSNIEQIKSRIKPNIMGYLTCGTFNKLKNHLESALSELKTK